MAKKQTAPRAEVRAMHAKASPEATHLSRRKFLEYAAGAGALLGAGFPRWAFAAPSSGKTESRTYVFNFGHMATSVHDLVLVAGHRRIKLNEATQADRRKARLRHPILKFVPDEHLTHHVTVDLPSDALQLCYVQRIHRGRKDGRWSMAHVFFHHPASALHEAKRRHGLLGGTASHPVPHKWKKYGLTATHRVALNDPVGEESLQDTSSHAVSLVAGHPELMAGEPNAAAHIQTNIIATQEATDQLAQVLTDQGPATVDGGWATQTPLINDATGQPYLNSQGQVQYVPVYSQLTGLFLGQAIQPSLDTVKNDTSLGVNVTDIDPTTITGGDAGAPTNGAVWTLHDGQAAVTQVVQATPPAQGAAPLLTGETALDWQLEHQNPRNGYSLKISGAPIEDGEAKLEFLAKNWYVRYLSLFVRYLDGNDQPIPLANLDLEDKWPEDWEERTNTDYDAYLRLVNPQWVILGFPVGTRELEAKIPIPAEAASVQILAGGLGSGGTSFTGTNAPGQAMTVIFNLAVPSLLLALAAAPGMVTLSAALEVDETALEMVSIALEAFNLLGLDYSEPDGFKEMAVEIALSLLKIGAEPMVELIAESIQTGEAESAVLDAIPIIGWTLEAIWAANLLASVVTTSTQVGNSPKVYHDTVRFTHDVQVTISHDPDDAAGFPATANHYIVTAQFDGGTPHVIRQNMPGTTVTKPIVVTFEDVPAGGNVKIDVGFYSSTDYLVGQGTVCPVPNPATTDTVALAVTIKEIEVPLLSTTHYSHKEIISLDSSGNHVWKAQTQAPSTVNPNGSCGNVNGDICSLTGITISSRNAAVGYAWQAYNSAVKDCASGALGQLHEFANISITENPQSKYLFSSCGFSGASRIVYDLMGKLDWNFYLDTTGGGNYIRQIILGATPGFDGPTSNKAFGRLQLPCDALLLHPAGKIVSISTSANKIEVLDLPPAAVADAQAPVSEVRSGVGTRPGLISGPTHAAMSSDGAILVLESQNNRIQAFDLGGNPVPHFGNGAYFFQLTDRPAGGAYLDISVEYSGYIFVLSYAHPASAYEYRLDIYTPAGAWLSRTTGINADKLAVNYWRDLFTLNYEALKLPNGTFPARTEPSVSHWIPSTPDGPVNVLPYIACP